MLSGFERETSHTTLYQSPCIHIRWRTNFMVYLSSPTNTCLTARLMNGTKRIRTIVQRVESATQSRAIRYFWWFLGCTGWKQGRKSNFYIFFGLGLCLGLVGIGRWVGRYRHQLNFMLHIIAENSWNNFWLHIHFHTPIMVLYWILWATV